MKTFLKILIARLKSYGTLNLCIMKAMKKTMTKKPMAKKGMSVKDEPVETKGSKGGNSSKVIAAISGALTGAAGIAQNIRNKRKTKKAQEELNKMKSEKATTPQAKYGMTMKSKSAKPKAMYGTSMKPGMMNIGGMVNSNTKAAVQKVAKGKVGGKSTAPKTAVPKAKYGMTKKK